MTRSLFSPLWHHVADLRPRLSPQARVHRHVYRDQVWYILQDQTGARYHRLNPGGYALVQSMDGERSVEQIWTAANRSGNGDTVTQSDFVELLVQLHGAELLQVDQNPDARSLLDRYRKKRRATFTQWLLNPMSIRIPLLDPDPWLDRMVPYLRWCVRWPGFILWLAMVLPALAMVGQHWRELTTNLSDQVLSADNLLILVLVFPLVKIAHELGHAMAVKAWGGAVHEAGVMLLVLAPIPYVEASASLGFPSKYQRAWVAAAGMAVELLLASLAFYLWLVVEPGAVRAVCFNVILIAGVSTLVINGNPLLRYDAYYILCDLIEMPNLAQRGQKYLAALWDRRVFGAHDRELPREGTAERWWLLAYTPLAWCYRTLVMISIILFIAGEFFVFGVLLALWSAITLFVFPLGKAIKHVLRSPLLARHRARAVGVSLALVGALVLVLGVVPVPLRVYSSGIVWLPEKALLRAGEDGFLVDWCAAGRVNARADHCWVPGDTVQSGESLFRLRNDPLLTERKIAEARVAELDARHRETLIGDPAKVEEARIQWEKERSERNRLADRLSHLVGRAGTAGTLTVPEWHNMNGRHFKKGEVLGYVLAPSEAVLRVVVPQEDIDLVRQMEPGVAPQSTLTQQGESSPKCAAPKGTIEVRRSDRLDEVFRTSFQQCAFAGGVSELPSAALSIMGGGTIPTDPSDAQGVKTIERVFVVDLRLPAEHAARWIGQRVHVRFSVGDEPLASQAARRLRQLFMSRFGV